MIKRKKDTPKVAAAATSAEPEAAGMYTTCHYKINLFDLALLHVFLYYITNDAYSGRCSE